MAVLPLTDWRVEQLRLSAFPVLGSATRSAAWWEQAAGFPPEETKTNPRKGAAVVSGSFGDAKLLLGLEPDRIDWILAPQDLDLEHLPAEAQFPSLGPLPDNLRPFSAVVESWLAQPDVPDLVRLAVGMIVRHEEPDAISGYRRLPDYIRVEIQPGAREFMYQINHPVPSGTGIANLEINRLSKWSVSMFRLLGARVTFTGLQPTNEVHATTPIYAVRLELDINTAAEFVGPIPRTRLVDIYRELSRLGEQIVREGIRGQ